MGGETDITQFLIKAQLDYKFFADRVLGIEVQPYQAYWVDCFNTKRRSCFTAPRGSGKTYNLGCAFPLWKCLFNSGLRFLISAASKDRAGDIVKEIRDTVEGNELLSQMLVPKGARTEWSSHGLKTKNRNLITVRAFTPKGIRGQHVNYALLDEAGEIEDHRLYFTSMVPTVTQRAGNICVIGTPTSELDLLSVLSEPQRGYHCRTYSMWDEETQTSLWPSKFPKNELDRLRAEQGSLNFRREYMCEMVDEGVQPFQWKDIVAAYDPELSFENQGRYYQVTDKEPSAWGEYHIGVDLALSPQGDYTVYSVIEAMGDYLYLRNMYRIQGVHYKEQEELGKKLYDSFKPMGMLVDKSNFGEIFISDLREMGVPADPFSFTPDNRNLILNNMMRLFENTGKKIGTPKIALPRNSNDEIALHETAVLSDELQKIIFDKTPSGYRTFRSIAKHDDTVMSLALAVYSATQHMGYRKDLNYIQREPYNQGGNFQLVGPTEFVDPFANDQFDLPF